MTDKHLAPIACFWCKRVGHRGMAYVPDTHKYALQDYAPCDACLMLWDQYQIVLIEHSPPALGQPAHPETGMFPTGRWAGHGALTPSEPPSRIWVERVMFERGVTLHGADLMGVPSNRPSVVH